MRWWFTTPPSPTFLISSSRGVWADLPPTGQLDYTCWSNPIHSLGALCQSDMYWTVMCPSLTHTHTHTHTHTCRLRCLRLIRTGCWSISLISSNPTHHRKSRFLPWSPVCPYRHNLLQSLKPLCHITPLTAQCQGSSSDVHTRADTSETVFYKFVFFFPLPLVHEGHKGMARLLSLVKQLPVWALTFCFTVGNDIIQLLLYICGISVVKQLHLKHWFDQKAPSCQNWLYPSTITRQAEGHRNSKEALRPLLSNPLLIFWIT